MKKSTMWMAAALMMATATVGCSTDNSEEEPEVIVDPVVKPEDSDTVLSNENNKRKFIELTRTEQQLVNSNNDFAFNLFRQVSSDKSEIVSPISITYALGMLNNGAAGETQAQINNVLGFGEAGADGINDFCRKMLTEATNLDKLTKVLIANTIYMNKDYELKSEFISKAHQFYEADPETRDFADGQTRNVINKWGNDHTEGMIPEVLKENEFNPDVVSYLLNAIYFKGIWVEKFDKADTKDEDFLSYTGKMQVPMMHQEHGFGYTETDDCQALRLPYGNGAYSMTILLPKEGKTINDVLQTLTTETWWKNYYVMKSAIVDLKLPRFESTSDIDLKKIMTALGMPNAFNSDFAEFPDFCNVPTYIGLMKQVAKIKLSEEGTEAAAVTVIGTDLAAYIPNEEPQRVNFHATRPFLYVISEQSTGTIFFIGQYVGD